MVKALPSAEPRNHSNWQSVLSPVMLAVNVAVPAPQRFSAVMVGVAGTAFTTATTGVVSL